METSGRQERVWRFAFRILRPVLKRRFSLDAEPLPETGPVILVCNHVTDLDPILLAMASPDHALTYVASDHILRDRPFLRKLLYRYFSPITRRKATSAVDTCRNTGPGGPGRKDGLYLRGRGDHLERENRSDPARNRYACQGGRGSAGDIPAAGRIFCGAPLGQRSAQREDYRTGDRLLAGGQTERHDRGRGKRPDPGGNPGGRV